MCVLYGYVLDYKEISTVWDVLLRNTVAKYCLLEYYCFLCVVLDSKLHQSRPTWKNFGLQVKTYSLTVLDLSCVVWLYNTVDY